MVLNVEEIRLRHPGAVPGGSTGALLRLKTNLTREGIQRLGGAELGSTGSKVFSLYSGWTPLKVPQ